DRPGIMLSGALFQYLDRFGVVPGERAVVLSVNERGWTAAATLTNAGVPVTVVDPLRDRDDPMARAEGIDLLAGGTVVGTEGGERLEAVHVSDGAETRKLPADLLGVCGGWSPTLQLYRSIGGTLRWDDGRGAFVPDGGGPDWLEVVGRAAGDSWP